MTSREFAEWMAYYGLEPFGERRADYRAALISSVIANVNRAKDQDPYPISDFLPDAMPDEEGEGEEGDDEDELAPWAEQVRVAEMITAVYGGTDKRGQ